MSPGRFENKLLEKALDPQKPQNPQPQILKNLFFFE